MAVRTLDCSRLPHQPPDLVRRHADRRPASQPGVSAAQAGRGRRRCISAIPIRAREHLVVFEPERRPRARSCCSPRAAGTNGLRDQTEVAADPDGDGGPGAVHRLRERRQPAPGARPGQGQRIRRCAFPSAPPGAPRPPAPDREPGARAARWRAGAARRAVLHATIAAVVETRATPILLDLRPNATVLVFTLTMAVLTGLLFGLAPAIGCTRVDPAPSLKSVNAAIPQSRRRWSTRQVLVAAQIGLCVLLVSGAGLLVGPCEISRHETAGSIAPAAAVLARCPAHAVPGRAGAGALRGAGRTAGPAGGSIVGGLCEEHRDELPR